MIISELDAMYLVPIHCDWFLFIATGPVLRLVPVHCDWFLFIATGPCLATGSYSLLLVPINCDWFLFIATIPVLRLMFKGRKCSDFRIYGKDNRWSKLEGRAADERVGFPFILVLLVEPLGSLAFLVQVSPRRSRWKVEFEPVAAC
ncbi:hypothetical protein F511_26619 [Dorcoceras hygrometricum]|uniref:Uncharacterized protein n=1 Tax=Dorcoceras hygrometricum TaxID=472368 RepID=A0A2Z7BWZ6_9LAMI|nr:hypothetical protein F511_26619 [Dorcoceras hygrometricum]